MYIGSNGWGTLSVAAGGGDGTLSVVQQDVFIEDGGGPAQQTITSATAGNLLICMTCSGGSVANGTSPSDNISGTTGWTTDLSQNTVASDMADNFRFRIHRKVAVGGETTIDYAGTWDNDIFCCVWEISKSSGTFAVDGTPDIGSGASSTAWGPETGITLAGDKSLILIMSVSERDPTVASPYDTAAVGFDTTTVNHGCASYANGLTGAQTLSSVFSNATTDGWISGAIGIRAS